MTEKSFFVAVDGGGTKTEAVLFTEDGKIINRLTGKGTNPNTRGIDNSVEILKELLCRLLQDKLPQGIFIGCAGCGAGDNAEKITKGLEKHFSCKIGCVSDILSAAKSITDESCICCIAGTGSTVAVIEENSFTLFSGTGALLGEAGSGYCIGRDALSYAVEARDFNMPESPLVLAAEQKAEGRIRDKIAVIYENGIPFIAGFAKTVFDCYHTDEKAKEIVHNNAASLSSLISRLIPLYPNCGTLALTGSVMNNGIYRNAVTKDLSIPFIYTRNPQVTGSALLCLEMCGIKREGFREDFTKNYLEFIAGDTDA